MAFREDAEALHARIESLERELETARARLSELEGAASERDRMAKRVGELEHQLGIKRAKAAKPRPGVGAPPPDVVAPSRGRFAMLGALGVLLVVALVVYFVIDSDRSDGAGAGLFGDAGPKPPDTRAPSIGVVDLSATPDPAPITFAVTGTEDPPGGCQGYLPDAPQLVLRTTTPTLVHITTRCNVDLVAVLTGTPAGVLCDDDSGGSQQPSIQTTLPAGETRLTIGTYSEDASASCEIELSATALPEGVDAQGLASTTPPRLATVSLEGAPSREAGYLGHLGEALLDASRIQAGCPGYVGSVPDLVVELTEPSIVRVDASAPDTDLVLLMGGPDGTFTCDDDDGMGNSPRIAKRLPPGRYPIWVGTFGQVPAGVELHAGVRLATLASEETIVVPSMDVVIGPAAHIVAWSGDELSAPSMWSDCAVPGYVPYEPTQSFRIAARGDVSIVSGRGDLLLAVTPHALRTATVRPCTTEPEWRGTLDAGQYDLYVGTASGESTRSEIDLAISVAAPSVLPYSP